MSLPPLTGAQTTTLRSRGQTLADGAWLGKDGVSPAFTAEMNRQLAAHELVKLRFTGGQDRKERATLLDAVAAATESQCVGAVGHTALFWRPGADGSKLLVG